jgi:hypothetical protein
MKSIDELSEYLERQISKLSIHIENLDEYQQGELLAYQDALRKVKYIRGY